MVSIQGVLIDAVWLIGLAGLLATAGYLGWYRQLHGWRWRHVLDLPLGRMPISLSLALIALGAALNGLTGKRPDPWWAVVIWFLLFFLFIIQTGLVAWAGDHHGWDSSTEGNHTQ